MQESSYCRHCEDLCLNLETNAPVTHVHDLQNTDCPLREIKEWNKYLNFCYTLWKETKLEKQKKFWAEVGCGWDFDAPRRAKFWNSKIRNVIFRIVFRLWPYDGWHRIVEFAFQGHWNWCIFVILPSFRRKTKFLLRKTWPQWRQCSNGICNCLCKNCVANFPSHFIDGIEQIIKSIVGYANDKKKHTLNLCKFMKIFFSTVHT